MSNWMRTSAHFLVIKNNELTNLLNSKGGNMMNAFNIGCDRPFHVAWQQSHSFFPAMPCDTPLLPCQTIRTYQNNENVSVTQTTCP